MASSPKFEYQPQNYVVRFGWNNKSSFLLLCYNVNHEYCFVDLESGRIFNMNFSTVGEAEKWLSGVAEIFEKNIICTTYVP